MRQQHVIRRRGDFFDPEQPECRLSGERWEWPLSRLGPLRPVLVFWAAVAIAAPLPARGEAPSDVPPRAAWTTSRVSGAPQPPTPYTTENAFPQLTFNQPVELRPIPGTDRLVVAELGGRIDSVVNDPETRERESFLDLKAHEPEMAQLYSLAFHPRFLENRQLLVCYVLPGEREDGSRISRFRVRESSPPQVDPESEEILLTWRSGGHNGCSLQFGPDGYLYISTGDATAPSPPDSLDAGQDISNLLSAVLRIDVDHPGPDRPYSIPADNPFVDLPGARPEIWAYGFRNPWRMSFDPANGDLWVGDVGWELWEMIYRVTRGGNYGWSIMEGRQPINLGGRRGPTPIVPPVVQHPHSEAASITGGYVYWGDRLPELRGTYIYGDYETGKVWGLRTGEQGEVVWHEELADTPLKIVSFGVDLQKELYVIDHGGTIHRFVPNPDAGRPTTFPRRLSETGLFTSVPDQQPAPGVVPYTINAPMWQDGATSRHWAAVPGDARIEATDGKWTFPEGTVLVKTLALPSGGGHTVNVETQLLHFSGRDWRAYSYRWDESQQDAELVQAEGDEARWNLPAEAGQDARVVAWQYASRADCLRCHNPWSGPPLAFDSLQLGGSLSHQGQSSDRLEWLDAVAVTQGAARYVDRPRLVNPQNLQADLNERARSYLHARCAHCHRMNAGGSVPSQMAYELSLAETQMIGARPTQGDLSVEGARVIAPGDPGHSVLLYRVAKTGQGRMPRLGAQQVDPAGLALLSRWIEQMDASGPTRPSGEADGFKEAPAWVEELAANGDADASRILSRLHSPAAALAMVLAIDRGSIEPQLRDRVAAAASQHPQPLVRDLFERFLPEEQRRKRLGDRIDPQDLLARPGDAERGEHLFFASGLLQCNQCHPVAGRGKSLGPDLSNIGAQRTREELLQSLLEPSRKVEPAYQTFLLQTVDGRTLSGLLVEKTAERITLRDLEHRDVEIPTEDVDQLVASAQSVMPEGMLRELTAQEAADLLAFLSSLRNGEVAP